MHTQWKRCWAIRVLGGLFVTFSHATQAMDIAPTLGEWRYLLCQPLSYVSLYARECTLWEEGEWAGLYSGGCINKQNPSPWADEALLIPKSLAFYGDLTATWHGWLGEGEKLPYNGCWAGPPRYKNGVEISNVAQITTDDASETSHLFVARRDRALTCPAGYVLNGSVCRPAGVNPHKNNEACVAGLNGSNPIHTALGYKL